MTTRDGKLTGVQLLCSIACFLQASSLLSSFLFPVTKQDSWISAHGGLIIAIPLVFVYLRLIRAFPGQNLMQIMVSIFGHLIGGAVNVLYVLFFLTVTAANLRYLGDFMQQTVMIDTPSVVILGLTILLCAYAVSHGLNIVTRFNAMFMSIVLFVLVLSLVLVGNQYDWTAFQPAFQREPVEYVHGFHITSSILLGEIVVFMMLAPNVTKYKRKLSFYWFIGLTIGFITLIGAILRDTAVLGNTLSVFALPFFETLRLVSLSGSLSRMEILFVVVLINIFFSKLLVLYYVSVDSVAQLFRQKSHKPFILLTGAFLLIYAVTLYPSTLEHVTSARDTTPFIWTPFTIIFPPVALLVAKLRGLLKTPEKMAETEVEA